MALNEEQLLYNEAWRIVSRAYVDESFNGNNWWLVRQRALEKNLANREATYTAIQASLTKLADPFTRLLRPDQYRSLQVSTSGELTGVGLQIAQEPETGVLVVIAPVEGSPAEAAGFHARDRVLEIDGVATQSMSLDDAAARMRGAIGTSVVLTVQSVIEGSQPVAFASGPPKQVTLVRQRIALNPVVAKLQESGTALPVGYIRLNQFNANAVTEVAHSVNRLEKQGAKAFVLDLRNNPGGLLQAGIETARLWLEDGTIVYTVDRRGILDRYEAKGQALSQAPLVVLVNEGTASASEILAGALQENDRALLVGQRTFGKGLIQSLFQLSDGSGLAVTVAKYETPEHHDINKQGITPDRVVPSVPLTREQLATEADPQYQAAIATLQETLVLAGAP